MLFFHSAHSKMQKSKLAPEFDSTSVKKFCSSIAAHVYNKPDCIALLLAAYAGAVGLQATNAVVGAVIVNSLQASNTTMAETASTAATGVAATYLPMNIIHELTSKLYHYLNAKEQHLIKNLVAILHDVTSSFEYNYSGSALNKQTLNAWINFGAAIITAYLVLMFFARDKLVENCNKKNTPVLKG